MKPTQEWINRWEEIRKKTYSPVNFNDYFKKDKIAGKELTVMDIGICSVPSGKLLVRDPLCYLNDRSAEPYLHKVPVGSYQTELCVVKPLDGDCARYAAARICFTDHLAEHFEEALVGNEDLDSLEDGGYFGFGVDAGLGCICDEILHQKFCDFAESWYVQNQDGNLYDDYFEALFKASYEAHSKYQRSGGDWINWKIPDTDYCLPIFQSGFGDGLYPVYWGIDSSGEICQIIIQFIDIQLRYGE